MKLGTERPQHFADSCCAGRGIVRCFVALHLLWLDSQAAGEAFLRHSRCDAGADQGFRQILDRFQNYCLARAKVEPLVSFNLFL